MDVRHRRAGEIELSFEPKSGAHAIDEVVFGLTFSRPFTAAEVDAVIAAHHEWRELLPRLSRAMAFGISFDGQPMPTAVAPISFDRLRPDGNFEWRLRVEGNSIFFNCLAYTRWSEIWPVASKHLSRVVALASQSNPLRHLLLQYIDVFEWRGDLEKYNVGDLLSENDHVPKSVLSCGPLWHLHQGWYREEPVLGDGRLLERLHFDAQFGETGIPIVRIDSYLQFEPIAPTVLSSTWTDEKETVGAWFEVLHTLDKKLLKSALSAQTADRIKLDV